MVPPIDHQRAIPHLGRFIEQSCGHLKVGHKSNVPEQATAVLPYQKVVAGYRTVFLIVVAGYRAMSKSLGLRETDGVYSFCQYCFLGSDKRTLLPQQTNNVTWQTWWKMDVTVAFLDLAVNAQRNCSIAGELSLWPPSCWSSLAGRWNGPRKDATGLALGGSLQGEALPAVIRSCSFWAMSKNIQSFCTGFGWKATAGYGDMPCYDMSTKRKRSPSTRANGRCWWWRPPPFDLCGGTRRGPGSWLFLCFFVNEQHKKLSLKHNKSSQKKRFIRHSSHNDIMVGFRFDIDYDQVSSPSWAGGIDGLDVTAWQGCTVASAFGGRWWTGCACGQARWVGSLPLLIQTIRESIWFFDLRHFWICIRSYDT